MVRPSPVVVGTKPSNFGICALENCRTLSGHSYVNSIAISPDGQILASGSDDSTIKLWNLRTGVLSTLSGHSSNVNSVVFDATGKILVSGSEDKTIKIWRFSEKKAIGAGWVLSFVRCTSQVISLQMVLLYSLTSTTVVLGITC